MELFCYCCLQKGPVMKLIHIKSQTSVALPIYTSDLSHLSVVEEADERAQAPKNEVRTSLSPNVFCVWARFIEWKK